MCWRHLLRLLACAGLMLALESGVSAAPRVRKELRSLTDAEYKLYVQGMSTMLSVATPAGQSLFGKNYKAYTDLIVKHAVASSDPRGDQGHNGPNFMTFHRAFCLEVERSLLAVVPGLLALPYLDITFDLKGGKYYGTASSVFSPKYAGAIDCASGSANLCQVTDGVFAWRQIPRFNWVAYNKTAWIYNGSLSTGLLRGPHNVNPNTYLTRFPAKNVAKGTLVFKSFKPAADFWFNTVNGIGAGLSFAFNSAAYKRCFDATQFKTWVEWHYCADLTTFALTFNNSAAWDRYTSNMSPALHASVHWLSGMSATFVDGDMKDTVTSPNEVLLFPLHHANIDRSSMIWQRNAQVLNATLASTAVMWGYPKKSSDYPTSPAGCFLYDVISSYSPFTDIFDGAAKPNGYTHFDVLNMTRPGNAIYTYDVMA